MRLSQACGFHCSDESLDVLPLVEYSLHERLRLIELHCMISSERAKAKSKVAEISRLQELVRVTDAVAGEEALSVACARVDELTTERGSLAARNEQAQAEGYTLWSRIGKLEVAEVTCDGELGIVVQAVRSWKERIAAGHTPASMAEVRARETLEKMSELC